MLADGSELVPHRWLCEQQLDAPPQGLCGGADLNRAPQQAALTPGKAGFELGTGAREGQCWNAQPHQLFGGRAGAGQSQLGPAGPAFKAATAQQQCPGWALPGPLSAAAAGDGGRSVVQPA